MFVEVGIGNFVEVGTGSFVEAGIGSFVVGLGRSFDEEDCSWQLV